MTCLKHNTWQIFPEDCNPIQVKKGVLMAHGGKLLMVADRNAALVVKELLKNDKDLVGLTVGLDKCQFYRGPACGEVLTITSYVNSLGKSRITVKVVFRDEEGCKVFDGLISFCSFKMGYSGFELTPHGKTI